MLRPGNIDVCVKHNMEIAHRLFTQPGKCQNIHGHGMQVTLWVSGAVKDGYISQRGRPLDFGTIKKVFRQYLDEKFDHHLHLNMEDPWAHRLGLRHNREGRVLETDFLPGAVAWPGDPSTENFAIWIYEAMEKEFEGLIDGVCIGETKSNEVAYWGE